MKKKQYHEDGCAVYCVAPPEIFILSLLCVYLASISHKTAFTTELVWSL